MKKMMKLLTLMLAIGTMSYSTSQAHETGSYHSHGEQIVKEFNWNFTLTEGEIELKKLNGWKYVSKIVVRAEGIRSDGTIEVLANGQVVGTIYAPGRDPNYIVTIKETVNSLEFRHVSGGAVKVRKIVVYGVPVSGTYTTSYPTYSDYTTNLPVYGEASMLSKKVISLIERLRPLTRYDEYGTYLLPIKKVAGRVYATARANGDLSNKVRARLAELAAQIDLAEQYIDIQLSVDMAFDMMVELFRVRDRIVDAID